MSSSTPPECNPHLIGFFYRRPWRRLFRKYYVAYCVRCGEKLS